MQQPDLENFPALKKYKNLLQTIVITLIVSLVTIPQSNAANGEEINEVRKSVVKIYTTTNAPDYFRPWTMLTTTQSSGSGSIIPNQRILTNAHVIANSSFIQVQKQGDSRKYNAKVLFVSHATDLAVLSVEDEHFFKDSKPLEIGKLPNTLDAVRVYGFPMGGKTLSITKGVLSRVEHQSYAHAGGIFLAGQIDAAINPGNSGGPVITNGKIVGVVMQANYGKSSENLGYFVPPSIIKHVLEDIDDGRYDGFRDLGFFTQGLESPALKKFYGINSDQTGVLVNFIFNDSPAADMMQVGDVVLKVNNFVVADDETINFRQDQRTSYKYSIDQFQLNEAVPITLNRKGKEITVEIPAGKDIKEPSLVREERFGELPEYYIYGGVLFVPLNMNLIKRWGSDWGRKAPFDFLQNRYVWSTAEREEAVVALTVFPSDVNLGYHSWKNWVIDEVNGKAIKNFAELTSILHNNTDDNVVITDKDGYKVVLNHKQAVKSRDEILQRYRISNYHSKDLFKK